MEVPKQRPRPKIKNFYFKTNFNEFFFLSFLMEIPICVMKPIEPGSLGFYDERSRRGTKE
jgi:hypothetical protein